jgi:hypothetical protein
MTNQNISHLWFWWAISDCQYIFCFRMIVNIFFVFEWPTKIAKWLIFWSYIFEWVYFVLSLHPARLPGSIWPHAPDDWARPRPLQPCRAQPKRKPKRISSAAPPLLLRHRTATVATGKHWVKRQAATMHPPPTSSIVISTWDATAMPISTSGSVSSGYNRWRLELRFQLAAPPEFWFQLTAAQNPITSGGGSAPIPIGGGPRSDFNLNIPIRVVVNMASITMF